MSIISFLFLFLPSTGSIYLSSEEYTRHTPSVTYDCPSQLKLNSFLNGSTIQLNLNGEKRRFAKDTIYGYRDCQGNDYRFHQNAAYKIIDTAGFYLYSLTHLVQGEKIARPAATYFFSANPEGFIHPLTIANLQKAFASNPKFCYRLNSDFRSNTSLNDIHKLKYAYQQSQ
ncbi:MAG: hypothetical protein JST68_08340 [Bacteroidetes bacterium]|nr:hypothetical protein [Bacteroidota bacterium]